MAGTFVDHELRAVEPPGECSTGGEWDEAILSPILSPVMHLDRHCQPAEPGPA